ncbi:MAG: histone deacetylase [Dehalococcoidia bacterium]|jgi:acetoin utilization deacetylase AcuC-like enzyme
MSTGYVNDEIYLEHDTKDHVEGKDRLTAINTILEKTKIKEQIAPIAARAATIDEIATTHDRDYIRTLKAEIDGGGGWLDPDTYVSPKSWDAALFAAGGLMNAVDGVMNKKYDGAFALVRPPGHHATRQHQMGFCLFNNVAVAARFALANYDIKRVLIVDFDVHHGNGTQDSFYTDSQVLYFSTHEYPWYPFTGRADETGSRGGEGYNVNVPMEADSGDHEYLRAFNEVLVPVAERYGPDLVLVSAGYDAHWKDNISNINLTTTGFARLAKIIKGISDKCCPNRLAFTLEGGYDRATLAYSVAATFEVLMGHNEVIDPFGEPPMIFTSGELDNLIKMVRHIHRLQD